jgi:hypothetical protein
MSSGFRGILAVGLFFTSPLCGTPAFAQGVNFIRHVADPVPLVNMASSRAPCTASSASALSGSTSSALTRGEGSEPCDIPAMSSLPVDPCHGAIAGQAGCRPLRDLVQEDLSTRGKDGRKILRARDRVLEILQSENSCSAWFREKDANPAATFRTLNFEMDRQGEDSVRESKGSGGLTIFRFPYVAKVMQADGSYGTITLNARGAFFSSLARIAENPKDGGPVILRDTRLLSVGPYAGDTLPGQILALLHEFGHIVDLLPTDEGDLKGRSAQNTEVVLRFCRAEVESKGKRTALTASR